MGRTGDQQVVGRIAPVRDERRLFAAGDIRADAAKQLVTAAGDGVTAVIRAEHYLTDHFDHRD